MEEKINTKKKKNQSSNYNNDSDDNDDNDATMVTSYWETIEITFENLLCNLIFHP